MPDDLLRFVSGTPPYSQWWLWLALALILLVIAWYAGVFVWTLPSRQLRRLPVIRSLHGFVLRRRFTRSIGAAVAGHRSGSLTAAAAGTRISQTLRSFLHQATGTPVQYMHVEAIMASELAAAGPVFAALNDVQFNSDSHEDMADLANKAEELIRTWS
ncbi:hypothetical protein GGC64_005275 [Mycobacterium sp. OAS707]|uniref:hypothetical protein n=1 Tax=Mycobacterium sp. OAS707 TaxID=2663822 RepID=UPI0017895694|nr:hypothetical protein [Mycobacterium sp. OAS707]